uniref:Tetratricopeptide repeat protein 17 n=1 Tax=Bombyx mori TaxID=7091 RepID=A0A8R2R0Z2_BOMMO|nr:tetratricopeptide repeat protein 17 isoform X2 [Bombyx mori]
MNYINFLWLFGLCTVHATTIATHWMVTETGLIQPRADSPFIMEHPNDLLAFLNQDTRWDNIHNLYYDLYNRQQIIDQLWLDIEKGTEVTTILTSNQHCVRVGQLNIIDWYTSFLEDGKSKGVPDEDFLLRETDYGDTDVPDCKKISSLTFSMFAFEHLEGLNQRENLSIDPELSLPEQITPIMTVDPFGHWLAAMLRRNNSSWLHYNMASLYWRVKGNAPKAMECSRRAVHYAPRKYKDIALLSMGTILHRSKRTEDAIVVLRAATDHDPTFTYNHFSLANAYAVFGDFNSSLKHFAECLKLNPTFELAVRHKIAVLCHLYVSDTIEELKETLQKLRQELIEYARRESEWLKSQAAFLRTMKHEEEFDYRNIDNNCKKMTNITGLKIKELKLQGDRNSLLQYFLDSPMYNDQWLKEKGVLAIESAGNLQKLVKHIRQNSPKEATLKIRPEKLKVAEVEVLKEIGPTPIFPDIYTDMKEKTLIEVLAAAEFRKNNERKPGQNKKESETSPFETGVMMYPPTIKINRNHQDFDVDADWPSTDFCKENSPNFPENLEAIYPTFMPFENKGIRLMALLTDMIGVPASVEHELPWHPPTCPPDKDITLFTQKKVKPQFSSEVAGVGPLRRKLHEYVADGDLAAAQRMQDAEIGQRIYAAMQKKLAPKWILYTLSSLYWRVRSNNINALHCLLNAGRTVENKYRDIVLTSVASIYLEMGYFDEAFTVAEEAFRLSLFEPATNFILAELNMINKHRKTHLIHLKQVLRVEPSFMGGIVRKLLIGWACILKQVNTVNEVELEEGEVCSRVETGTNMVCEKDGSNCQMSNVKCFSSRERAEIQLDNILLEEEDCSNQHLQLSYWLHVSFRQMLSEADLGLVQEITATPPAGRKVPDCRAPTVQDFFIDRMITVDTAGWEPVFSLMHQLAEMFNFYDYTTLGSKIAKYVESHPSSWSALMWAGWWCGAGGRGPCAARCLCAAHAHAPAHAHTYALSGLVALLHMQSKQKDAKDISYLALYSSPKSKNEAFLVALSHTLLVEYDRAIWMYRYALSFDDKFLPASACLHATMCLMIFGDAKQRNKEN